jgi:hypothetical protein
MATASVLGINKALSVRCMQQAAVDHRLKCQYALVRQSLRDICKMLKISQSRIGTL